jgi:hypothetical protein
MEPSGPAAVLLLHAESANPRQTNDRAFARFGDIGPPLKEGSADRLRVAAPGCQLSNSQRIEAIVLASCARQLCQ